MSKASIDVAGASSSHELEIHRTIEEERERRKSGEGQLKTEARGEDPSKTAESKEERLKKAGRLMEETESVDLDLQTGDLAKVDEDIIVEKTESGFVTYIVVE